MPRLQSGYAQGDEEIMNYKLQISNVNQAVGFS